MGAVVDTGLISCMLPLLQRKYRAIRQMRYHTHMIASPFLLVPVAFCILQILGYGRNFDLLDFWFGINSDLWFGISSMLQILGCVQLVISIDSHSFKMPTCSGHLGSVFTLASIHLEMCSPWISIHLASVFTLKCIYLGKYSPCNVFTLWCIHFDKYALCKSIHHELQFTQV